MGSPGTRVAKLDISLGLAGPSSVGKVCLGVTFHRSDDLDSDIVSRPTPGADTGEQGDAPLVCLWRDLHRDESALIVRLFESVACGPEPNSPNSRVACGFLDLLFKLLGLGPAGLEGLPCAMPSVSNDEHSVIGPAMVVDDDQV